ncbi:MAG TPA: hypothetical protein VH082_02880, partial [Rudaea sp.]|nr:hypothetical protein [Rudaea sp.]
MRKRQTTDRGSATLRRSCLIAALALIAACSSLRTSYVKPYSAAFSPPKGTPTAQYVANTTADHSNQSGFRLLSNNIDALMSRVVLADKAAKSIDL